MKKLLFSVVSVLALCGVALAAGSTEFGVLCVPSSARETIVSVPWLGSGSGNEAVKVSDLVLTAGLNAGDQLLYYTGNKGYDSWVLQESGGVKTWVSGNNVSEKGLTISSGAATQSLLRGRAIILKRGADTAKGETIADKFFLMGKPTSETAETTLDAGYSLVAPPSIADEGTDVNSDSDLTWENIVVGDQLLVPNGGKFDTLSWKDGTGWRKFDNKTKKWISTGIKIPSGTGVWFKNGSGGSGKKVIWGKQ